jgi:predicted nucleic acid-binding protein
MAIYPRRQYEKFEQVICDTDIFLHLIRNDEIELLEMFAEKILVPEYVKRVEIRNKAGRHLGACLDVLANNDAFKVVYDKDLDLAEKISKKNVMSAFDVCGLGERHCIALAVAIASPPIVVSNNDTEFYLFKDYSIPLAYYDLLIILVAKGHMDYEIAEAKYNKLNNSRGRASAKSFSRRREERIAEFKELGIAKTLDIRF